MQQSQIVRYERCSGYPLDSVIRTKLGLKQFEDKESKGIEPENPDSYYYVLMNGKRWWEWQLNDYAKRYLTDDWEGWSNIFNDFCVKEDDFSGFRQIVQRVCQGRNKEFIIQFVNEFLRQENYKYRI